jgi:hypothetical protein
LGSVLFLCTCYIVKLLVVELILLLDFFCFHNCNVLMFLLLFSAAKVGKIFETIVSLAEKYVSNQEKCQESPWTNITLEFL